MGLILKGNFCFEINGRLGSTGMVTLYTFWTLYVYLLGQDEFLVLAEEVLLPGGVLGPQGPPDQRQQNLPL